MADWDHDFQIGDMVEAKDFLNNNAVVVGRIIQLTNTDMVLDNGYVKHFGLDNVKKIEPSDSPAPIVTEMSDDDIANILSNRTPRQETYSREYVEKLKAEMEFNSKEHMAHLNEIWSYITDGLGDWEYPGQIMRRAKEVMEENRKLKASEFNRTAGELSNDTELCRKCNTVYTNHLSGICIDCRKEG